MLRQITLACVALLPLSCSTTGESRYAAHDRAAREAAAQPEATEAEDEAASTETSSSVATESPRYSGSEVRPAGLRTDSNPAYVNNRVQLEVSLGGETKPIVIELDPEGAPIAVANFKQNVANGSYDGLAFHRSLAGYLIQSGDPLTHDESRRNEWGTGGPDYTLPYEDNGNFVNGTVGIARLNDGVNPERANNGSQFFITLGNQSQLNGKYTAIGRVVEGLDTLTVIGAVPTDENDVPLQSVTLTDAELVEGGPEGEQRITWETGTVPKITKVSASRSARSNDNPAFVGPPRPGTWRSFINRVW